MNRRINVAALGLLLGLAATGCAQEREPIDRVQPNVLKKTFFLGDNIHDSSDDPEFLTRAYSSGASYDQPTFYYGTGSGVDRIRFEVTEDLLIARKAYQVGRGRDDKGVPEGEANGTVVAAFRIDSHFDVRQSYNPVTGETTNVTEENTTDRPWYEREFIRVDWSTNEVANPMYLDELFSKWFGDPKITPMRYYVTDPTSEDAPVLNEKEGYLEITNRYFVEPGMMNFSWGSLPSCVVYGMLSSTNVNDCNMQAADIRLAFWKVDPDHDFESFINTKAAEDVVNNFGSIGGGIYVQWGAPISDYDPAYGYTDEGYHIPMHVINIWEKSHVDLRCSSTADDNHDGTADACAEYAGSKGSRCDTFVSWKKHQIAEALPAEVKRETAKQAEAIEVACEYECKAVELSKAIEAACQDSTTYDECVAGKTAELAEVPCQNPTTRDGCKVRKNAELAKAVEDSFKVSGKCTIPYRDRVVKTKGWFVNKEMPLVYQDTLDANGQKMDRGAIEDIVYSWNQLFTASVAMARSAECRRTGDGDRDACHLQYFKPEKVMVSFGSWLVDAPLDEKPVFTLCHNPVRNYDIPDACGEPGDEARTGDLRKFFLIDWPSATNAPFGGVTSLHTDPTSGELIGDTSLTVHIEARASRILDTLLVAMGDMSLEEYMGGAATARYSKVMTDTIPAEPLSEVQIQERVSTVDQLARVPSGAGPITEDRMEAVKAAIRAKNELKADENMRAMQALRSDQLLAPLRGTTLESDLTDSHWLNAARIDPNSALNGSTLDAASPLRNMDAAKLQVIFADMEKRLARAGACFTGIQDAAQMGQVASAPMAEYFRQKYGHLSKEQRIEEMRKELRIETFKGVMLHEMGHALGMRHQFSSSWDAPNFMPQYWQLRTNEGTVTNTCPNKWDDEEPTADLPDRCMGPRYFDPHTPDERGEADEPRPMIEYFGNTSTMEYQSENFMETAGLGTWDYHMAKAIYGRVLETYDPRVMPRDGDGMSQRRLATRMVTHLADTDYIYDKLVFDYPPTPPELDGAEWMHSHHYTKAARAMNIFDPNRDCRPATAEEKGVGKWRVVHNKVCQPYPRDYAVWDDFVSDLNTEAEEPMVMWHTRIPCPDGQACADSDRVRWSYRIGEHYEPSYVHTNMMDTGADVYEVTVNEIRKFNAQYPMNYFRRHRRGSPPSWYTWRYALNFFEQLRSYHWSNANTLLRWKELGYYDLFKQDSNWSTGEIRANKKIFDALVSYVLAPQPGDYRLREGDPSGVYDAIKGFDPNADFVIQTIDGRFVDDAYDEGPDGGGSWEFQDYETRAGFSVEKAYAFLALCDSRPTLSTIARETYLDGRAPKLNFRSDMPLAFDRLFGGMLAEDWQALGMSVPGDTQPGQPAIPRRFDLLTTVNEDIENPTRPAGSKVLFPNLGYTQQLYAAIFSALYARENTDMTLIHKMRIWIDGVEANISDVAFPGAENQIRFYDPNSGFTYIARRFGTELIDNRPVELGIASRMMERANQLVTLSFVVETDTEGNPVLDEYGRPVLILDGEGHAQPLDTFDSKQGELIRYVGLVDAVRQLGHILGQGPY